VVHLGKLLFVLCWIITHSGAKFRNILVKQMLKVSDIIQSLRCSNIYSARFSKLPRNRITRFNCNCVQKALCLVLCPLRQKQKEAPKRSQISYHHLYCVHSRPHQVWCIAVCNTENSQLSDRKGAWREMRLNQNFAAWTWNWYALVVARPCLNDNKTINYCVRPNLPLRHF